MQTTWKILSMTEVINNHPAQYDDEGTLLEPAYDTKTVTTSVEFIFDDNDPIVLDVAHFNPQNDDDILIGIQNRAISERRNRYGIQITV